MMVQIPVLCCPECDAPIRSMSPRFAQRDDRVVSEVEGWDIHPCGHVVYDTFVSTPFGHRWEKRESR